MYDFSHKLLLWILCVENHSHILMRHVTSRWWSGNKTGMWVFITFISFNEASMIDSKVMWTSNSNHRSSLVMRSNVKRKSVLGMWAGSMVRSGSHMRTSCKGWKTKCTWLILQKPTLTLFELSTFARTRSHHVGHVPCKGVKTKVLILNLDLLLHLQLLCNNWNLQIDDLDTDHCPHGS